MSTNATTAVFRVSYPNVFEAKLNDMNGKHEYSLVAVFPKGANLKDLKAAAQDAIEAKWGKEPKKWPKPMKSPFRDHSDRAKEDDEGKTYYPEGYEEGGVFINLKSAQRPGLVDSQVKPIIDQNEFYAGCYAIATVSAYAFGGPGTKFAAGVAFGLRNIQKVKDGDPISGRSKPEDDFKAVAIENDDDDAPQTKLNGKSNGAPGLFD